MNQSEGARLTCGLGYRVIVIVIGQAIQSGHEHIDAYQIFARYVARALEERGGKLRENPGRYDNLDNDNDNDNGVV